MKQVWILYEVFPYDDSHPQDVAVYPSLEWAKHMKKENEKESPSSNFELVQSFLAEEGDVIL